jgi:transposase-like protein
MKFTIREFNDRFPTSDSCLEELKELRYSNFTCPKCKRNNMLSKIAGRPQYQCPCGYQISPLAGTIFNKSRTDLRTWFYVMYVMTQTRAGISAKSIQRETGVTYKCACRMMHQIRNLMNENSGTPLGGDKIVEIDEAYLGGVVRGKTGIAAAKAKGGVQGMVERHGRMRGVVIKSTRADELITNIKANVKSSSTVMTDQLSNYRDLPYQGYPLHWTVDHSRRQYALGPITTNTIEGFWGNFKSGVEGVYRHVSLQHLQSYVDEYTWRYSNRKSEVPMFELLLNKIA